MLEILDLSSVKKETRKYELWYLMDLRIRYELSENLKLSPHYLIDIQPL